MTFMELKNLTVWENDYWDKYNMKKKVIKFQDSIA